MNSFINYFFLTSVRMVPTNQCIHIYHYIHIHVYYIEYMYIYVYMYMYILGRPIRAHKGPAHKVPGRPQGAGPQGHRGATRAQRSLQGTSPQERMEDPQGPGRPTSARSARAQGGQQGSAHKGPGGPMKARPTLRFSNRGDSNLGAHTPTGRRTCMSQQVFVHCRPSVNKAKLPRSSEFSRQRSLPWPLRSSRTCLPLVHSEKGSILLTSNRLNCMIP